MSKSKKSPKADKLSKKQQAKLEAAMVAAEALSTKKGKKNKAAPVEAPVITEPKKEKKAGKEVITEPAQPLKGLKLPKTSLTLVADEPEETPAPEAPVEVPSAEQAIADEAIINPGKKEKKNKKSKSGKAESSPTPAETAPDPKPEPAAAPAAASKLPAHYEQLKGVQDRLVAKAAEKGKKQTEEWTLLKKDENPMTFRTGNNGVRIQKSFERAGVPLEFLESVREEFDPEGDGGAGLFTAHYTFAVPKP